ncbi:MAG: hypothetical protein H7Y02_13795 [Candidatus Obscuribacterales bacterium]|nr:hypothetical protein [Steroidobacteraceae bacterium]
MPTPESLDGVRIDVITSHHDGRGVVFEPLAADEINGFRNVHVVVTEPGAVRGNHRHTRGREITSVLGPMSVRFREAGKVHDVAVPAGEVWRFCFPPGIAHAFHNTGERACVLASFNTEEHDQAAPDVERDVLIDI